MLKFPHLPKTGLLAGGVLAAALAAPALAQTVVDEVIVTGRYGVGPEVRSLSAPVSYRDLDLTSEGGRSVLRERVRAMAHDLCRRLGEQGLGGTPAAPSCEQDAVDRARDQERRAIVYAPRPLYVMLPPPDTPYVAEAGVNPADEAAAAPAYGEQAAATVTTETVTNGPVPDTPQNRARFGGPMSNGGQRTAPAGN